MKSVDFKYKDRNFRIYANDPSDMGVVDFSVYLLTDKKYWFSRKEKYFCGGFAYYDLLNEIKRSIDRKIDLENKKNQMKEEIENLRNGKGE